MRLTFLGTGTSHGIPVAGCACRVCRSHDERDVRWRTSLLVEEGPTVILVDAGPEFRLQAIRAGIRRLDGVLLTHAHADHIMGLDDLRPFMARGPLPVRGDLATLAEVRERFSYAFVEGQLGGGKPSFDLLPVAMETLVIGDLEVRRIPLLHGRLEVSGWRLGDFAYLTDCSAIPEPSLPLLEGVKVAAIDGLRLRPSTTHFSVDEAIEAARRLGLSQVWLTHICHEASHTELEAYCAQRGADLVARPAWDGLVLEL